MRVQYFLLLRARGFVRGRELMRAPYSFLGNLREGFSLVFTPEGSAGGTWYVFPIIFVFNEGKKLLTVPEVDGGQGRR